MVMGEEFFLGVGGGKGEDEIVQTRGLTPTTNQPTKIDCNQCINRYIEFNNTFYDTMNVVMLPETQIYAFHTYHPLYLN